MSVFLKSNEGAEMQLLQSFAIQVPLIVACSVFVMAALFKAGKEKGAGLIAVGAVGLCLLVLMDPLFSYLVMPKIVQNMDNEAISNAYLIRGIVSNLCWTAAIFLVAVGTFLRSPKVVEGRSEADL